MNILKNIGFFILIVLGMLFLLSVPELIADLVCNLIW